MSSDDDPDTAVLRTKETEERNQTVAHLYKEYLAFARPFIEFASISTSSEFHPEIIKTVHWLSDVFQQRGFSTQIVEGYGNPLVMARMTVNKDAPTVLVYGHYDVQPAQDWSDAFQLQEREERIFGRGVVDNKGQVGVHVATIFSLLEAGRLKYNVVFLFEGNEESDGIDLDKFVEEYADDLRADVAIISDGIHIEKHPTIEFGFRGNMNVICTAEIPKELHPGDFGSVAPNPANVLMFLLNKIDENFPLLNDDVPMIDPEIVEMQKALPFSADEYKKETGVETYDIKEGQTFHTQTTLQPSMEITSFMSGYDGDGFSNSIPKSATAKINIRTVAGQDQDHLIDNIQRFIQETMSEHVHGKSIQVKFEVMEKDPGVILSPHNPYIEHVHALLSQVYEYAVLYRLVGSTLPVAVFLDHILHLPQVHVPLANADSNIHAKDENFHKEDLFAALWFSYLLFSTAYLEEARKQEITEVV